MRAHLLKLISN